MGMPELILGPVLRYVSHHEATVWVETDGPCEVEVLDHTARTFEVAGHHFALVVIGGLAPGSATAYEVHLDGHRAWPPAGDVFPPCSIRTLPEEGRIRLAFGSCRVCLPHHDPYTLRKDHDDRGREIDSLFALTRRMRGQDPGEWPHVLLGLGDQVYADELSPRTEAFITARRGDTPPAGEVADFEEYTRLYREAWQDPAIRWLLSTVSNSMIWDDHDVHDDWNTSWEWVREMRARPWWEERIIGAIASYWVYQHLGNLSPRELAEDDTWAAPQAGGDITAPLRDFARRADRETAGARWSYYRDLGAARLVVMDSRAGRVLDDGRRSMVDDDEWSWIADHARGGHDHLLLGTSLPWLLSPAMHCLEAWNEAVCDGAWGRRARGLGERMRQGLDLEHWAAFHGAFDDLTGLVREIGAGEHGEAPATIVALSGDVHHSYLADVAYPRSAGVRSAVHQAVSSPVRNPLDSREKNVIKAGMSKPAHLASRLLARSAGVRDPALRWKIDEGPWFDNVLSTLDIEARRLDLRIERARPEDGARFETVLDRQLA
jgi:PhoD-like phosphatase